MPTKIAELIYNYDNNWGNGLPNVDFLNGNPEEKQDILLELFKREARFHIEFIRIHPFEDGNGRTGRIILNAHLANLADKYNAVFLDINPIIKNVNYFLKKESYYFNYLAHEKIAQIIKYSISTCENK